MGDQRTTPEPKTRESHFRQGRKIVSIKDQEIFWEIFGS